MKKTYQVVCAALFMIAFILLIPYRTGTAALLWSNEPLPYSQDPSYVNNGSEMHSTLLANPFQLTERSTIDYFRFWTLETYGYQGIYYFDFYDTAEDGSPGSPIFSGAGFPGSPPVNGERSCKDSHFQPYQPIVECDLTWPIAPLTLDPGQYFLSIHNSSPSYYWVIGQDNTNLLRLKHEPFDGPWIESTSSNAFEIYGTSISIPEPSTAILLGVGLISLILKRRKNINRAS